MELDVNEHDPVVPAWVEANPSPTLPEIPMPLLDRLCANETLDGSDREAQDAILLWAMALADSLGQPLDDRPETEIVGWMELVRTKLIGERLRRRGLVVSRFHGDYGFQGPSEPLPVQFPVN